MTASFDFAHHALRALRSGCLAINYFGGMTLSNACGGVVRHSHDRELRIDG